MTLGPENLGNGSATTQDRYAGGVGSYRQSRRDGLLPGEPGTEADLTPRNGSTPTLEPAGGLDRAPTLPSLDLGGFTEPVFPPAGWLGGSAGGESLADHPLLRGLLLELPPKGAIPAPGWLDRWFEAARCILELLYVQEANRGR